MLKIEKYVLPSPQQWEMIVEGVRNPLNSWDKSDSYITYVVDSETGLVVPAEFFLGEADHKLMMNLSNGGSSHAKYRRMIPVMLKVTAPLYWWKEFDTYKVGTVANSCSTMHKIADKTFHFEDFSYEHLFADDEPGMSIIIESNKTKDVFEHKLTSRSLLMLQIELLNIYRKAYLETKNKDYWWQMIQLLPSSYNQTRTVMLNYEVLKNIYHDRRAHKLDEWHTFCDWIEQLPYFDLIGGAQSD